MENRTQRLQATIIIQVLVVCSMVSLAWATSIESLPDYTRDRDTVRSDWLVKPIEVKSDVFRTGNAHEIVLCNGLIRRTFRLSPNGATVGFDNLITGEAILRGVKPEALIEIDGVSYEIGGLKGQSNYAFLRPQWIDTLAASANAFVFTGFTVGKPQERIRWKRVRHHDPGAVWPPHGAYLRMDYQIPKLSQQSPKDRDITVSVHYELYDGVPVLSKWITVHNNTERTIRLNRFASEILAAVEYGSAVEDRGVQFTPPNIHVETEYAFSGMTAANTARHSVHWLRDPDYQSQVNYLRNNPCLLEVRPTIGPDQDIEPGASFTSFHAFIKPNDSFDRERNGLAQRRMYRVIAPWVTENPLMMHVRYADWKSVKKAIDQCAEVGFEMVILTFGSGFNIENDSDEYIAKMTQYAD